MALLAHRGPDGAGLRTNNQPTDTRLRTNIPIVWSGWIAGRAIPSGRRRGAPEAPISAKEGSVPNEREFGFQVGSSKKFWRIEVEGAAHTIRFGRIGSAGQI